MPRRVFQVVLTLAVIGAAAGVWLVMNPPGPTPLSSEKPGDPERGRYVLAMAGCVACHTNAKDGGAELAGGAPLETPFGTFHPPNITPHEDGIGGWTLADFNAALTAGIGPDGSHLYPAFPYTSYTRMTEDDIRDLWAALQEVEPVAGRAPPHELSFPFDQRWALGAWKTLFLETGPLPPPMHDPDPPFVRGRYIATGPGHCVECHSPRNVLGAVSSDDWFEGTSDGPEGDRIPAITPEALEAENWTESDVAFALELGMMPSGDVLGGTMGAVVQDSTSKLTPGDRAAIAHYLMNR